MSPTTVETRIELHRKYTAPHASRGRTSRGSSSEPTRPPVARNANPDANEVIEKIAMLWIMRTRGLRTSTPCTSRVLTASSVAVATGPSTIRLARSITAVAVA